METNYPACEARILVHEGGYTDGIHPYDPGGCTNFGCTIYDAKKFWKQGATCADVRMMPKDVALNIIKKQYWDVLNCDNLPAGVDDAIVDYGYNSGNSRSGKVLRRLLSLPDTDWHVTAQVIAECKKRDPVALINAICDERLKFLRSLAIWPTYGGGWTRRVKEVRQYATQLADHAATPTSTPLPTPPTQAQPGKGKHPSIDTGPVVTGGGAATVGAGGLAHYLTGHPEDLLLAVVIGATIIGIVIAMLRQHVSNRQDAATPGVVPVPPRSKP